MPKKKDKTKTTSEIISELSILKFAAEKFAQNPERSKELIELQASSLELISYEISLRRDFSEVNLLDAAEIAEFSERCDDFRKEVEKLHTQIKGFKNKVGL
jgi:hypothetical protein